MLKTAVLTAALAVALGSAGVALSSETTASQHWRLVGSQGAYQFVVVDKAKERDRGELMAATRALCGDKAGCFVRFWSDDKVAPRAFPLSPEASRSIVAAYDRNRNTGVDELRWSCRIDRTDRCLASTSKI